MTLYFSASRSSSTNEVGFQPVDGMTLTLAPAPSTNTDTSISVTSKSSDKNIDTAYPLGMYSSEQIIKKSRFIALAIHCSSHTTAQKLLQDIRREHPKARHVCYALRHTGSSGVMSERGSDDGEPTGTACAPILGAIRGLELSDTLCTVVRYSGGIKLGAGGLIRAYGGAARQTLLLAEKEVCIPQSSVRIRVPAAFAGVVYETVRKVDVDGIIEQDEATGGYDSDGNFEAMVTCDARCISEYLDMVKDATRGQVEVLPLLVDNDEDNK